PRGLVAGGQRRVGSGDAALAAIAAPGFDARREAIVEGDPLPVGSSAGEAGAARIVSTHGDRQVADVRADRDGVLVVSDAWAPGWQARVDGRRVDVRRVDYLFRGVPVRAGRHTVEFAYRPLR